MENFTKEISGSKLPVDSKNVNVLFVWRSVSNARDHFRKKLIIFKKFTNFYLCFDIAFKFYLQTYTF
jgi:hypothetical protein